MTLVMKKEQTLLNFLKMCEKWYIEYVMTLETIETIKWFLFYRTIFDLFVSKMEHKYTQFS